jgi:hypothetical protein
MKSEILDKLHCINKCLLLFLLVFYLAMTSLEFPAKIFLVTCSRETLLNE